MRVRSRYFVFSGALGGLLGSMVMELATVVSGGGGRAQSILQMAIYFSGFGLAVGAALGMTEGVVCRSRSRLLYGLALGLLLGAVGGFVGGAVGQVIYGLVPVRFSTGSSADIAIALDSSGSMSHFFFFGSDPFGERKKAAEHLIDRLSPSDRVAIVDFDNGAAILCPLTFLDTKTARQEAKKAIGRIDNQGGTNLSAGLDASLAELARNRLAGRSQYIIFLTDGVGDYDPASAERARLASVVIYTVGLGDGVNAELLARVALSTGGKYYPVADAKSLTALFERILSDDILMTERGAARHGRLLTNPALPFLVRILSWAVMGLAIGAGQGMRENTREDLRACALGGLLGGAVGGALFNPITAWVTWGSGLAGRAVADIVVGASIGGSIRLVQDRMVEAPRRPTRPLVPRLPQPRW